MQKANARKATGNSLAIRSIDGNLGHEPAGSFHRDLHKDLKADCDGLDLCSSHSI